ncbi:hypothetical protein DFH07DRAFT_964286 [Mycena maculata]|uniref:Uncharacterized protein n=1 Tax=Mycena maculata TaxID=230809 RepID=A0AAD7N3L3_9AGAR|nr:hypothetical protein DFH07DRAFT_964286 [Mycena maculata]
MNCRRRLLGRHTALVKLCLWLVVGYGFVWLFVLHHELPSAHWSTPPIDELGRPTFRYVKRYEKNLPQLRALPSKGTDRPRYLFFAGAQSGSGWNNVLQEQLLNNHLAHLSQRAYVFPHYVPEDDPRFPEMLANGTRSLIKIPINALVSGPTGGGPLSYDGRDSLARRAVPEEYWHTVCPPAEVVVVNLSEAMHEMELDGASDGQEIMASWADKLLKISAPCVSIEGGAPFDYMLTGSSRVLSIWPSYSHSPILKYFAWSPIVTAALFWNFHLLSQSPPPGFLVPFPGNPHKFESFPALHTSEQTIPGLLGIHVRRGDYESHCVFLAEVGATYNAWSLLGTPGISNWSSTLPDYVWPALPDYLDVPPGQSLKAAKIDHCWPSPAAIVARAHKVREGTARRQALRRIYISTNGDPAWVRDLTALLTVDGWEVSSSLDMVLTLEGRAVSQAVDMGVLTSAESFIGVGFSSLTSNVVQLRLAGGRHPDTIHFW